VGIADYLRDATSVRELGGGVSNKVMLAEFRDGRRIVVKQALPKLRVAQDWFADRTRIFRECAAIRRLAPHLPAGSLPEVLCEDRENYAFVMTAVAGEPWKSQLLRGEVRPEIAARIGELLAAIWRVPALEAEFCDQSAFDQLRLDPYYRATARVHPDLAGAFEHLLQPRRIALVHGDWSPKNFLVDGDRVTAIDFEVVHFGDPAFDIAFLLNHLALKSFLAPRYWPAAQSFLRALPSGWPEERTIAHLGGLMLARIDGKSPVEYLNEEQRVRVRGFARELMLHPPDTVREVFARI
jgi:5-methylthioribose kinase